jgi:hypothetical protein
MHQVAVGREGSSELVPTARNSRGRLNRKTHKMVAPESVRTTTISDLLANRWQTAVRVAPGIRQAGCWTRLACWFGVEPPAGIEPATPSLPWMCSAD